MRLERVRRGLNPRGSTETLYKSNIKTTNDVNVIGLFDYIQEYFEKYLFFRVERKTEDGIVVGVSAAKEGTDYNMTIIADDVTNTFSVAIVEPEGKMAFKHVPKYFLTGKDAEVYEEDVDEDLVMRIVE